MSNSPHRPGRSFRFTQVRHIPELLMPWAHEEEALEEDILYVVDGPQDEQLVEYNCPCGCGNVVFIPYYKPPQQKEEYPSWALQEREGKVTLSPSVFSTGWPCRSHYFIRDNEIVWC